MRSASPKRSFISDPARAAPDPVEVLACLYSSKRLPALARARARAAAAGCRPAAGARGADRHLARAGDHAAQRQDQAEPDVRARRFGIDGARLHARRVARVHQRERGRHPEAVSATGRASATGWPSTRRVDLRTAGQGRRQQLSECRLPEGAERRLRQRLRRRGAEEAGLLHATPATRPASAGPTTAGGSAGNRHHLLQGVHERDRQGSGQVRSSSRSRSRTCRPRPRRQNYANWYLVLPHALSDDAQLGRHRDAEARFRHPGRLQPDQQDRACRRTRLPRRQTVRRTQKANFYASL